jgi:hypothetical protein
MYETMDAVLTRRDQTAVQQQDWLTNSKRLSDSRVNPAQQLASDDQKLNY